MPKGIKFTAQASNPLSTDNGIWFNTSNEMIVQRDGFAPQNVTSALSGGLSSGPIIEVPMANNTGSTITKGTPVTINASGTIKPINVSTLSDAYNIVGVAKTDISNSTVGNIVVGGVLDNLTTGLNFGDAVFVSKTGTLTNVLPSIGVAGFVAQDYIIRVGTIFKNSVTLTQKDLLVNVSVVAQL